MGNHSARTLCTALWPQGHPRVLDKLQPPLKPSTKNSDVASEHRRHFNRLSQKELCKTRILRKWNLQFGGHVSVILIHSFVNCHLLWTHVKIA